MANYKISYYNQIRNISGASNVLIGTSYSWPKWLGLTKEQPYKIQNEILLGITADEFLMTEDECPEEMCQGKPCKYSYKFPECQFLVSYWQHLKSLDFDKLLLELNRIAEDVRKITHYDGEPTIILMVYESPDNLCSERASIIRLFKEHDIELTEWSKDLSGIVF